MSNLKLYTYFRSSAAYRVRIALNLKQLGYNSAFIHLLRNGGEEKSEAYRAINPQAMIPSLELTDTSDVIHQSLAIIEYLEECHPQPSLVPGNALLRAQIRAFALAVCCDIHPLNNLRVHAYLRDVFHVDEAQRQIWYQHWIREGFVALESKLQAASSKNFCFGEQATLADVCLIPQVYNAIRFHCDMSEFPRIEQIYQHCLTLDAFKGASPEAQADYE